MPLLPAVGQPLAQQDERDEEEETADGQSANENGYGGQWQGGYDVIAV